MIDNIIAYVNHGRRFISDINLWDGQQTGQFVFDDTAMLARNMLVDGMVGYLCSRNQPWFALELPGKFNFPRTSGMRAWTGQRIDSNTPRSSNGCRTARRSCIQPSIDRTSTM